MVSGRELGKPNADRVLARKEWHLSQNESQGGCPLLSIVIPVYNEENVLPELKRRLDHALQEVEGEAEIVFADDGSRDGTSRILNAMIEKDSRVVVVRLSRNFGHQPCIMAGLAEAKGGAVILLDGDLEDPPELIPELVKQWKSGSKVVIAVRRSRKTSFARRLLFAAFHRCIQMLSDFPIVPDAGTYCLLDRAAVDALNDLPEAHRFFPGLRSWIGFDVATVPYDREARFAGEPKQSMRRLFHYAFDAIFGFSYKPLRLSLFAGVGFWLFSMLYAIILVLQRILGINVVRGFTTNAVLLLFFGSTILVALGILGEYVGRIYDEVKRRPLSIKVSVTRGRGAS